MSTHEDSFAIAVKAAIDAKTKPLGSLGKIEALASQIAHVQNSLTPKMTRCRLTIFAADHGIATAGVSAYPQEVTRQMVQNFLSGGAAANVLARVAGIEVQVVDCGVAGEPIVDSGLVSRRIGAGTANALTEAAMSQIQMDQAITSGRIIGSEGDYDAVCFGEMGIGNTSSASLLMHKVTGLPLEGLVGRGTGVDDDALAKKGVLLSQAASRTNSPLPALEALLEYGGFEIATMTGAMKGAADAGRIILVDGFIASAAAMIARDIWPEVDDHLVWSHYSAETGHQLLLRELGVSPLLDLGMRLGEGTGAILAWPLVKSAAAILNEMATFETAAVSGPAKGGS